MLSADLDAFLRIAEEGTVRAASVRLGLTQTAVTRRLANLEGDLHCSLFLRTPRGMVLTEQGALLLRASKDMAAIEQTTLAGLGVSMQVECTHMRIRGPSSLVRSRLLPASAAAIVAADFEVTIEWQIEDLACDVEALKRMECDFIVVAHDRVAPALSRRLLRDEAYVMVVPKAWEERTVRDVASKERIVDFNPADTLTQRYLAQWDLAAVCRPERHFANNTDGLAQMVSLGMGYSVLSVEFASPFVARGELAILEPRRVLKERHALAWHPRRFWPSAWKRVLAALR